MNDHQKEKSYNVLLTSVEIDFIQTVFSDVRADMGKLAPSGLTTISAKLQAAREAGPVANP